MKRALIGLASHRGWLALAAAIVATAISPTAAAEAARSDAPRLNTVPAGAVFAGVTAQRMVVRLGRQRGSGRTFKYQARLNCSDDSMFTDYPFTDLVRLRRQRFFLSRSTDAVSSTFA